MADDETFVWRGSPSQIINVAAYAMCAAATVAIVALSAAWDVRCLWLVVVPAGWAGYKWLTVRCTIVELTTERLRVARGILAKHTDELELYRVKDTTLHEPLAMRLAGAGTIIMDTSDKSTPQVLLRGMPGANRLRESLRTHIEALRTSKGIRELDID